MASKRLERIAEGRTDLVLEHLAEGQPADAADPQGVRLIQWCAYYGDVSAVRALLERGESLPSLGEDLGLIGAAFHGHWRLCEFLLESGANANVADAGTGETPLHAALCTAKRAAHDLVLDLLLTAGASPNATTKPGVPTGSFMRDCRTRAETPLHRAAAFGTERTIDRLLRAGSSREAKDMNGDTPLAWASWHLRPDPILRLLCYGDFNLHPDRQPMEINLLGRPRGRE
jgi:ankyrin repeat protein